MNKNKHTLSIYIFSVFFVHVMAILSFFYSRIKTQYMTLIKSRFFYPFNEIKSNVFGDSSVNVWIV